jgi:hypothetical protein
MKIEEQNGPRESKDLDRNQEGIPEFAIFYSRNIIYMTR